MMLAADLTNRLEGSMITKESLEVLNLAEIAGIIRRDWGNKLNFAARPYLEAMFGLGSVDDSYGMDSGKSVVRYFLCNASSWHGEVAKLVKKELNRRVK
jgi:hypothetical protein